MPSVNLTPQSISTNRNDIWSNITNGLVEDGAYTEQLAGSNDGYVFYMNFSSGLPQDITITGIEVNVKAGVDSVGSGTSLVATMSLDGMVTTVGSSVVCGTPLGTGLSYYTVGSSAETYGYSNWKRPNFASSTSFSVSISVSGDATPTVRIDHTYITVHYTLNTYLRGERSRFDTFAPPTGNIDNIPRVYNGSSLAHQVQSEQVNLLGDCLYELEKEALNGTAVRGISTDRTLLTKPRINIFTATITGVITEPSTGSFYLYTVLQQSVINGTYSRQKIYTNLASAGAIAADFHMTEPPLLTFQPESLVFNNVNAVAWYVSGGVNVPLNVSCEPVSMLRAGYSTGSGYTKTHIGLHFVPVSIYDTKVDKREESAIVQGPLRSVFGTLVSRSASGFSPAVPFYVKIMGFGMSYAAIR